MLPLFPWQKIRAYFDRAYPYHRGMSEVAARTALALTNGCIQIAFIGGCETKGGVFDATQRKEANTLGNKNSGRSSGANQTHFRLEVRSRARHYEQSQTGEGLVCLDGFVLSGNGSSVNESRQLSTSANRANVSR